MAEQQQRRRHLRTFATRKDVLDEFNDDELVKRFRLDRAGIIFVTDMVRDVLQSSTQRNHALTPEMKVVILLRYLATGKMQQCSSDDLGISQSTVSRVITETLDAFYKPDIMTQYLVFPTDPQVLQRNKAEFMEIAGFPGVVGTIDCTHIRIQAPKEFPDEFLNRKRYHSMNVQLVFNARYEIMDCVATWPGSVHDSRILNQSGLKKLFDDYLVPRGCLLLGDSGYLCKTWLLTPYLQPQPGPQTRYNRAHKQTRNLVERGIGQLKRRFHVLHGEIRVNPPSKVKRIICVCAMLHNICKQRNIILPDETNLNVDDNGPEDVVHPPVDGPNTGLAYRDHFAVTHFP